MKKKTKIIVNPVSGVRKKNVIGNYAKRILDGEQFDYDIVYTKKAGHATELARKASVEKYDVVIAAGGDGTINEVAKGLVHTNTRMGFIPIGSGNGLAHHLKISTNPASALEAINRFNIRKIDTVKINNEMFVSIAGIGFDARIARKFSKSKHRGFLAYFGIVSREYPYYKPKKYQLVIDGNPLFKKALLISFANSNQFGYNTQIAPDAKIDDGLIDVCIVHKVPLIELPIIAHLLYWNQIDKSKYVEIIKAREIKVLQNRNRYINLDGESVKLGKQLNIQIDPMSLNIIAP